MKFKTIHKKRVLEVWEDKEGLHFDIIKNYSESDFINSEAWVELGDPCEELTKEDAENTIEVLFNELRENKRR